MAIVGLVSIPGMMTGQILAGNDPFNSAIYQIIIMFIICFSTFTSTFLVIHLTFFRLFDKEHRFNEKLLKEMIG
jgi:putative ABC transport system permease protein